MDMQRKTSFREKKESLTFSEDSQPGDSMNSIKGRDRTTSFGDGNLSRKTSFRAKTESLTYSAAGRTVLLVGDAQLGGCATVAALHLARASGVSPSATLLSLRNACPAALHHQVDLDALAALAF